MTNSMYMLFAALALSVGAFAETTHMRKDGVSVDVTLEPSSFTVGDTLSLQIKATTYGRKQLKLVEDGTLGSFTIVDQYHLLDVPNGENRSWIWSMHLDTFDATTASLEGIEIHWIDVNGEKGSISIDPISVQIKSVAGTSLGDMPLRDIKGSVPLITKSWWFVLYCMLALIAILSWLLKAIIFRTRPACCPHALALKELQALAGANLDVLPFYTELSNIVRRYLEARFHIAATGQTTREFLIASKSHPHLEHSDRESLASFLVAADLVKFARFEPTNNTCVLAIDEATLFIESTAPSKNTNSLGVAA